ncbi:epoxide hydrolase family protein [Pseudonocardia sp. MH-G8]|uniref:epoxide hydrolase family protein n=1 Tax=Pseudonocardia sp. MH-G8 TaxID=1854588 RepID=UPI000B9FD143|nr:epoxide hydrolase family protein [Pseudonocardia sp. MH-G8]OZM77994.1 epoxide hydrolase [Pseudonocardia sp. MH-G8]
MAIDDGIEPFALEFPESELRELRDRLRRVRMPERETVSPSADPAAADWRQGVPLAYLIELARSWAEGYDWRRFESEFNAHGPGRTRVFDLDIAFLHVRSPRADARPLVLTHGWPSSVIEPLEVADALANPAEPDAPAFHVVAPALPGFGPSGRPSTTGWSVDRTADAWAILMSRLGYDRFAAAGGDWGGRVATALGVRHPHRVEALHTFTPYVEVPPEEGELTDHELAGLAETRGFWERGGGYSLEQSTKPQTIAYGLSDSPIAQLAWIVEKFQGWTDCGGHPENAVSRERMLDTVTLYWLTGTGGSSARFYWENFPPERSAHVHVPTAVTIFPRDIERLPRSWVERRYRDLRVWSEVDRGGHFPMLEVPERYVAELRSAFAAMQH